MTHRVTVFDYGAGNLHSLTKAIAGPDLDVRVESDATKLTDTDIVVLPGVGAFAPAVQRLAPGRAALRTALEQGLPCVGICLGMQLLFDTSDEGPGVGLEVIAGSVKHIDARRSPHIGWNTIEPNTSLRDVYYAHTYVCRPIDVSCVTAWTTVEQDRFPAIVRAGRTVGVQFHPEKSSRTGVEWLQRMIQDLLQPQTT